MQKASPSRMLANFSLGFANRGFYAVLRFIGDGFDLFARRHRPAAEIAPNMFCFCRGTMRGFLDAIAGVIHRFLEFLSYVHTLKDTGPSTDRQSWEKG